MARTNTYAETSSNFLFPLPAGEIRGVDLTRVEVPSVYDEIVYIVHPSRQNGDYNEIAHETIQKLVDSKSTERSRVIAILDPNTQSTYLSNKTRVTDIRTYASEEKWVDLYDSADERVKLIFCGGGQEKCLAGAVNVAVNTLLFEADTINNHRNVINITLPIEAIYSEFGMRVDTIFKKMLKQVDPLKAILSLLTTTTPRVGSGSIGRGQLEIIPSNGSLLTYELSLNDKKLATLSSPAVEKVEEEGEVPEGWVKVKPHSWLTDFKNKRVNINVIFDESSVVNSEGPRQDYSPRYLHADEVLKKYNVTNS